MRKIIHHTIACLALLLAGRVVALEVEEVTYQVFVDVPTLDYYVLPVDPLLFIKQQQLHWNITRSEFTPLRTYFNARIASGGLKARLQDSATLQRGFDNPGEIQLKVMLNNILLSTNPQLIMGGASAQNETRLELVVSAIKPVGGYKSGTYQGAVSLIFEPEFN